MHLSWNGDVSQFRGGAAGVMPKIAALPPRWKGTPYPYPPSIYTTYSKLIL